MLLLITETSRFLCHLPASHCMQFTPDRVPNHNAQVDTKGPAWQSIEEGSQQESIVKNHTEAPADW